MRIVTVLITLLMSLSLLSFSDVMAREEIYRWVDENGVVHFGNRADAASNAEKVKIQKAPDYTPAESATTSSGAEATQPNIAQQQREERAQRKQDVAKKRAEREKECNWHRGVIAKLEPMPRVIEIQEDGSAVRMDDNDRLERIETSREFLRKNCD